MQTEPREKKSVLLLGATGLIGSHCLGLLQNDDACNRIILLTRRPLPQTSLAEKTRQHVIDFDRMQDYSESFAVDQLFICLGATRKKAGSKAAFYRVDFTYALQAARLAAERNVSDLLLVSSLGAHPGSVFFYSRVKGQLEQAVGKLPFRSITVFRPSVLLGRREQPRPGEMMVEKLSPWFDFLFPGPLKKFKPIQAEQVARAMVQTAQNPAPGIIILESDQIQNPADSTR